MSRTQADRIDDALSQLVERVLPDIGDQDEAEADERYYAALDVARESIDQHGREPLAADAAHISDIIQRRLIREHQSPDSALRFANLYNRLLSQPVLSQKWAILYLLNQLSNPPHSSRPPPSSIPPTSTRPSLQPPSNGTPERGAPSVTSTYDDAFARNGLPLQQQARQQRPQSPPPFNPQNYPRRGSKHHNGDAGVDNDADTPIMAHERPSEADLLRDIPYLLQGISSKHFAFTASNGLKIAASLPAPLVSLHHTLAEPALLYRSLSNFVESNEGGLVTQSLRSAISIELRSYLALVATLEGQIRRALAQLENMPHNSFSLGRAGVTLKRCVIWTREATMGLRLMTVIVEEAKARRGGQIISLIHSFSSSHGDTFVSKYAERLLSHVTRPFYDMLRPWIYDGELSDPYEEFFVTENSQPNESDVDGAKGGATSVWEDKYKLDADMTPSIITSEFAQKVFLIGKSLNFIRYGCGDSAWVEQYSRDASRELHYGDTALLESSIDAAYTTTMARLTSLMNDKFHLQSHLAALKKYLLLGQGDFIALLMESLSTALDRPATSQYRHALTAQLEHAIRNSNAQFDSEEVLRRLDARMLELSHGEVGWDVFTLEYKIDAPVDVIVTAHGSKQYLKVFNFLWRVKRVEFALGTTWRRFMTGARGILSSVDGTFGKDWKAARCSIAEMIHFVTQLQYYILFEVIEASWVSLQNEINKPGATLDDLIAAHATYLRSITRKGLLSNTGHLDFPGQLHELLKVMLSYKEAVDSLYACAVQEYTRQEQRKDKIERRTRKGQWGITERDRDDMEGDEFDALRKGRNGPRSRDAESPMPPPLINIENGSVNMAAMLGNSGAAGGDQQDAQTVLTALRSRMTGLSSEFRARITGLLGDLAYQPDMELRFLGVVMNFNDTYTVVRRSKRKDGDRSARRGVQAASSVPASAAASAIKEHSK